MLSDIRDDPLKAAVKRLQEEVPGTSQRVEGFLCDVTKPESVSGLLASVKAAFGDGVPIQFVAANAGIIIPGATLLGGTPDQ